MNPNPPPIAAELGENTPPPDAPPILGSWRRMYILVLVAFLGVVLFCAFLTKVYQ